MRNGWFLDVPAALSPSGDNGGGDQDLGDRSSSSGVRDVDVQELHYVRIQLT